MDTYTNGTWYMQHIVFSLFTLIFYYALKINDCFDEALESLTFINNGVTNMVNDQSRQNGNFLDSFVSCSDIRGNRESDDQVFRKSVP
jgi:hypothetical protein